MHRRSEWRGDLPVVVVSAAETGLVVVGTLVATVVGGGLAAAIGVSLASHGFRSNMLVVALLLAPPLAWLGWARRRRAWLDAAHADVRALVASPGRLFVDGAPCVAWRCTYGGGQLRVHAPLAVSHVLVEATLAEADAIALALAVPEQGIRTVDVWSPLGNVPVLGTALTFGAPCMAVFAAAVLGFASHLSPPAMLGFAALLLVASAVTVATLAPRRIVVGDLELEERWLGRSRSIPIATLESITLEGDTIVVSVRGTRPRRLQLAAWSWSTTLERARAVARARSEGPIARARARSVANVFE